MIPNWETILPALPEEAFFELVRNYLGPVKTPFHKPDIITRLSLFLQSPAVRDSSLSFLDREDARILTLVDLYQEASEQDLRELFSLKPYPLFRKKLLNLEERLLIWKNREKEPPVYTLSPLGAAAKEEGMLGVHILMTLGPAAEVSAGPLWLNDGFLSIALGLLMEDRLFFLKEGNIRKRVFEDLRERFSPLFVDSRGEERFFMAGRALMALGLIRRKKEQLLPRLPLWQELADLPASTRQLLLLCRAAAGRGLSLAQGGMIIRLFKEQLPPGRPASQKEFILLIQSLAGRERRLSSQEAQKFLHNLVLLGILGKTPEGKLARPSSLQDPMEGETKRPQAALSPTGDLSLLPGAPLNREAALAMAPVRQDVTASFRMDRLAFLRGIDAGVNAETLARSLEKLTGQVFPENLMVVLKEWEQDYQGIQMYGGIVFTAEEKYRSLIEGTGVLTPYIQSNPAPGIWVLNPQEEAQWREALRGIGIGPLPPVRQPLEVKKVPPSIRSRKEFSQGIPPFPWDNPSWDSPPQRDTAPMKKKLEAALKQIKLREGEEELLREHMERRLILVPEQIRPGAVRLQKMSAKGLDYRGKTRLIEAAIHSQDDRLEISFLEGLEVKNLLLIPLRLEKKDNEYVLAGQILPKNTPFRVKVRKIGFLKRVRVSLF